MKNMDRDELIRWGRDYMRDTTARFDKLASHPNEGHLKLRPFPNKWSVLECIDHLNKANHPYLKGLEKAILNLPQAPSEPMKFTFMGSILNGYVNPDTRKTKPAPAPGVSKPDSKLDPSSVFKRYRDNLERFDHIFEGLADKDINKKVVPSLLPILKVRSGEALHLLCWHNRRHMIQADEALTLVMRMV